jgi:hypothetical protein
MLEVANIAIDIHSDQSVLACLDNKGEVLYQKQFETTELKLIGQIERIPAKCKRLAIEQTNISHWVATIVHPFVDELIVADSCKTALDSQNINKNDFVDASGLANLLRLGALEPVYVSKNLGVRTLHFNQVKEYERITHYLSGLKQQLTSFLRHWGYRIAIKERDYRDPGRVLDQIEQPGLAEEVAAKFEAIAYQQIRKDDQQKRFMKTAKNFWEISQFLAMPGCGDISAHRISGYIQEPNRFSKPGQIVHFSKLAVANKTSNRKKVGRSRLSKAGHSSLKQATYRIWHAAVHSCRHPNEINTFYQQSLKRTGHEGHARLNTQRKIIIALWTLWKKRVPYDPTYFASSPARRRAGHQP